MRTSKKGIELIAKYEGLRLKAYLCPAGILTIGYGHTKDVKPGMIISEDMAVFLLKEDLQYFEDKIEKLVTVPLTQNQFDALASFTFNLGEGNLGRSTLLRLLNEEDYYRASLQFKRWDKAWVPIKASESIAKLIELGIKVKGNKKLVALPGLTRRREDEYKLFISEV